MMVCSRSRVVTAACIFALMLATREAGQTASRTSEPDRNWASWRGPSGQGYSNDAHVPLTWGEGNNLLWTCDLPGRGNSSPVAWGDRIFLTSAEDRGKERYLLCVGATDGKLLWKRLAARESDPGKSHPWNEYASPSCTTDGACVYAFFGTPGLFCYDVDGKLLWQHRFGVFTSDRGWGVAASPFLFEDLVIQNCDNDGRNASVAAGRAQDIAPMALVALDKKTGTVRWQAERNMGKSYSTPVLVPTPEGRVDLVLNSPQGIWAYDPHTGREVWHCDRKGDQARFGEPMPVFNREAIFEVSGRPGPVQAFRLGGTGNLTAANLLWQGSRKGHRDVASPILWGDCLYCADNQGMLTCYEARDGNVLYQERLGAKVLASPIAVRGKLLFLREDGMTVVVEPGREFKVVAHNKLGNGGQLDFVASPAVADGRLFLRSQSRLYGIAQKN